MSAIPGDETRRLVPFLAQFESRGVTTLADDFPVFWKSARGSHVWDVDGNRYVDLTAAFGVAATGHGNERIAEAIATQAGALMHSMGDVHPTEVRVQLLRKLAEMAPAELSKGYLSSTGSEAVEAALKTAALFSGRPGVASFHGAYHGLSIGALAVCGIEKFRAPFLSLLPPGQLLFEYPRAAGALEALLLSMRATLRKRDDIGAIIVEPIQGRAGIVVPPAGFLRALRGLCDDLGLLLIFDEIFTGFGRTGSMFVCTEQGAIPDILCLGKAIANGFPLAATLARPHVMDAWRPAHGEALHTSTYLGNPMGCAAALATIAEIERLQLPERARELERGLAPHLDRLRAVPGVRDVRGRGLMWGIELPDAHHAQRVVKTALQRHLILLQAGETGNAISITPPLVIEAPELHEALGTIAQTIAETA